MITDVNLTLSVSQAVTVTAFSGNTLDLNQIRDAGAGEELNIYVNVEVAATAAGAATVNFQVVTSSAANLATATTIVGQSDAIPKANLTVGAQIILPLPRSFINQLGQRFLGLQYTIGTGPLTAGTFSAGIILDAPDNTAAMRKVYPSGFLVK